MKKLCILLLVLILTPTVYIKASEQVILGGDSIGIVADYNGLYVTGTYQIKDNKSTYDNSKTIHNGDIITAIDGFITNDLNDFNSIIESYETTQEVNITINRSNKIIHTTMIIVCNEKKECGLYLKEKTSGIGTLTYYDPETKTYGCLGHSITNENNHLLQEGDIYTSTIHSINKAENNNPGEKIGKINYDEKIGSITKNTDIGVFGIYENMITQKPITTASLEELREGNAFIYTVIENDKVEKFEINITKIDRQENATRIEFKVTDQTLIDKCGGIIHGMSGSPIIQDGKLVGAVTHVLVNDPTRGYGIFIENMLNITS